MKIKLSDQEAATIERVLDSMLEWAGGDDRPDHGLGRMRYYREQKFMRDLLMDAWRTVHWARKNSASQKKKELKK